MAQSQRLKAYKNHIARCRNKRDALGNPVEMRLSFEEWCRIWDESGKWEQRGRKNGQYCMSRINDIGHYELSNVFIQLHSKNSSEIDRSKIDQTISKRFSGKQHDDVWSLHMSDVMRGKKNPRAILDEEKVREIKILLASGNDYQTLADKYGVSKPTIQAINNGRNWKHVTI